MSSDITHTNPCPAWCAADHAAGDGAVHRAEVGRTTVGDLAVPVVILQTSHDAPSVVVSGPLFVAVNRDDADDMATLLELSGQGTLAGLVRLASERLDDTDRAPYGLGRQPYVEEEADRHDAESTS